MHEIAKEIAHRINQDYSMGLNPKEIKELIVLIKQVMDKLPDAETHSK